MLQDLSIGNYIEWVLGLLVLVSSLIQISPIKLNPWDSILKWVGRKLNGDIEERFRMLEKQVSTMWINSHRNNILRVALECRAGIDHSPDEWMNVLNIAEEYEKYVQENNITNGIITQDTAFLRKLYQELSYEHKL